ncbi:hypothetical protein [Paraburkholderia unamae]|uniref:hypothetical protein n=1 Tax=Paraburkholderia unamae TaxID=219649 RepID=UPI0011BDAA0E|nr:hypothetical protein [Paraburkholderia unamae]
MQTARVRRRHAGLLGGGFAGKTHGTRRNLLLEMTIPRIIAYPRADCRVAALACNVSTLPETLAFALRKVAGVRIAHAREARDGAAKNRIDHTAVSVSIPQMLTC